MVEKKHIRLALIAVIEDFWGKRKVAVAVEEVVLDGISGGNKTIGGGESGRVKDYLMEWIGSEKKERPKKYWLTTTDPFSSKRVLVELKRGGSRCRE
ncbi:hypothetical protein L1987_25628 [Smallanthus sonchifolius]|uniref:Uncharacterized protein n=1 Tax=Smallanthus sonchifolius TaxID=185202 RepID=A0ACB9IB00_9ASTR|nr:hypothetical protein L1987_25628 [Smallanthus sonchifolius]